MVQRSEWQRELGRAQRLGYWRLELFSVSHNGKEARGVRMGVHRDGGRRGQEVIRV